MTDERCFLEIRLSLDSEGQLHVRAFSPVPKSELPPSVHEFVLNVNHLAREMAFYQGSTPCQ